MLLSHLHTIRPRTRLWPNYVDYGADRTADQDGKPTLVRSALNYSASSSVWSARNPRRVQGRLTLYAYPFMYRRERSLWSKGDCQMALVSA